MNVAFTARVISRINPSCNLLHNAKNTWAGWKSLFEQYGIIIVAGDNYQENTIMTFLEAVEALQYCELDFEANETCHVG